MIIDPNSGYELSGYLRPQGDVKSAYLRISWYASFDGTGTALATDDSTVKLTLPTNDFVFPTLGGPNPAAFDWGLPFFIGRKVFVALEGHTASSVSGPFWAY